MFGDGDLINWILGAGVLQGVFLVIALSGMRVRNGTTRWLFVAIIAAFTVILGFEFLDLIGDPPEFGLTLLFDFVLAPLLYLFVCTLAEDDPAPLRDRAWHFAPFIGALAFIFGLNLMPAELSANSDDAQLRNIVAGVIFGKAAYFLVYASAILSRPLALGDKPEARQNALRWVRRWLALFVAAYLLGIIHFAAFFAGVRGIGETDQFGGLLVAGTIYALGYFALINRDVFDIRRGDRDPARSPGDAAIAKRAIAYLDHSRAYLDSAFSLRTLAEQLGVSDQRLSGALNSARNGGFSALVNERRLNAFCAALAAPENRSRSLLQLAHEAGFNSKATLYRNFKTWFGATPAAYRRRLNAAGDAPAPNDARAPQNAAIASAAEQTAGLAVANSAAGRR